MHQQSVVNFYHSAQNEAFVKRKEWSVILDKNSICVTID